VRVAPFPSEYPVTTVLRFCVFLLAVALAGLAATASAGTALGVPVTFAFGRTGGNIRPFTITIARDGSVAATGPVQPLKSRLDPRQLAKLARVVNAQRFFALPQTTLCPDALPDVASQFVIVHKGSLTRRVLVHGGCSPGLTKIYTALTNAVGLRH
jgi:hypothetical protein